MVHTSAMPHVVIVSLGSFLKLKAASALYTEPPPSKRCVKVKDVAHGVFVGDPLGQAKAMGVKSGMVATWRQHTRHGADGISKARQRLPTLKSN